MKKQITLITIILFIALVFCSCTKTNNDINNYASDVEEYKASAFMPDLGAIGEYENIDYFSRKDEGAFPHYSLQLVVQYDEENYFLAKEQLNTAYTYLEEPQKPDFDDTVYSMPTAKFETPGFNFRIAMFEDTVYPKNFGMVGTSDENFEIAYLWTYAPDLDYICKADANETKAMGEFIREYFSME